MLQFHSFYTFYLTVSFFIWGHHTQVQFLVWIRWVLALAKQRTNIWKKNISGIQAQVSLGWLYLKDLSFFILLRFVLDIYIIYICLWFMCYLRQWRLLREVHVQHLRILWGFTTSFLWSGISTFWCGNWCVGIKTMIHHMFIRFFFLRSNVFRCMFFQNAAFLESFDKGLFGPSPMLWCWRFCSIRAPTFSLWCMLIAVVHRLVKKRTT